MLQIENRALFDFSIVDESTTYDGTGISVKSNLFNWVYKAFGIPFVPGIINTHPITCVLKLVFKDSYQSW